MQFKVENNLPEYYLITGNEPKDPIEFLNKLEMCLQQGLSLVQLRAKYLIAAEYQNLAKSVIALCGSYKVKILLNNYVLMAQKLGASGVHLTSASLLTHTKRPLGKEYLVSASCHNKTELLHANKINVDFVTLSPVLATTTHPDTPPLGWNLFESLVKLVDVPIFALGGLERNDLPFVNQCGAHGIAAISALWDI